MATGAVILKWSRQKVFPLSEVLITIVAHLRVLYQEAANRLANNILTLQGYFTRELLCSRDEINAQFEIDEDELDDAC